MAGFANFVTTASGHLVRRRWAPTPPGRRSPDHVVLQEGIRLGLSSHPTAGTPSSNVVTGESDAIKPVISITRKGCSVSASTLHASGVDISLVRAADAANASFTSTESLPDTFSLSLAVLVTMKVISKGGAVGSVDSLTCPRDSCPLGW